MNPIRGIGPSAGVWGPAAGHAARAARDVPSLRDVEPQRGISLPGATRARESDFSTTLSQVLSDVNALQQRADHLTGELAAGRLENIHDVMIAQQEAGIALRLIQEVRDKLVAAYQELMRMQV